MKFYRETLAVLITMTSLSLAANAAANVLDEDLCLDTLSGTWTTGATDVCEVIDMELLAGEMVQVAGGTELNLDGDSFIYPADPVAMLPAAQIEVDTSAEMIVDGTLTNRGFVRIDGHGIITGSFVNIDSGNVEIHGLLTNHGYLQNQALLFVKQFATLESDDTILNGSQGTFSILGAVTISDGSLTNFHDISNAGTRAVVIIEEPAMLTNSGGAADIVNFGSGRIGVHGVLNNTGGARLINDGSFLASTGKIINFMDSHINNINGGLIANVGTASEIENRDGGRIQNDAMIHNLRLIENFCAGTILNTATGVISNVGAGRLDNFGGTILNAGTIFQPPVLNACVFNP